MENNNKNIIRPRFVILLASYNGEPFIAAQIESIRLQTETDWLLLVRDDGSTDNTVSIVEQLTKTDKRVRLVSDGKGNSGSAQRNFFYLMDIALNFQADVFLFADQDDIWFPFKLEEINKQIASEDENWNTIPMLFHSDLKVVNKDNITIAPSFFKFQGLQPKNDESHKTLLVQNFVTGCTCAFNRKLLEYAHSFDERIIIHDWWVSIVASLTGKVVCINQPLVRYRQHDNNQIGAKGKNKWLNPLSKYLYVNLFRAPGALKEVMEQIGLVTERFHDGRANSELMTSLHKLKESRGIRRVMAANAIGLKKQHWTLTLYMYLLLFFIS